MSVRTILVVGLFVAQAVGASRTARAEPALSIEKAVEIALRQNAELASLGAEVRAAEARLRGASLLLQDNPEISLAAGRRSRGSEREPEYEAALGQRLEIFGQRAARIEAAKAARAAAAARLRSRRVGLAAQVREAFAHALAAESLATGAQGALELARRSASAAEKRFELGDGTRMEVNTARVEVGRAARELSLAQQRRASALGALRLLMALDPAAELRLGGRLEEIGVVAALPAGELLRKAVESHPDLETARQELAEANAERRQAQRESLPSPRLEARFAREERADVWLGGLSFDLPLFNQNQAARGVAGARVEQATRALEAGVHRVRQDVALAVSRMQLAREATQAYEGDVVRAMEENLQLATTAYQAGKIGLVELLVIRRDTLDARRGYVEAREELVAAAAELARALGRETAAP